MKTATINIYGRPTTVEILQGRAPQHHKFSMIGGCTLQLDYNSFEQVDFSYLNLSNMELEFEIDVDPHGISVQTFSVDADGDFMYKSGTYSGNTNLRWPFKGSIIRLLTGVCLRKID